MDPIVPLLNRVDTALASRLWYMKPEFRKEIALEVEEAVKVWMTDVVEFSRTLED